MKVTRAILRKLIIEEIESITEESQPEELLTDGDAVKWKAAGKWGCVSLVGSDSPGSVDLYLYVSREGGTPSCENMAGSEYKVGTYSRDFEWIEALTINVQKAFDDEKFLSWINHQSEHKIFPHGPIPKKGNIGGGSDDKSSGGTQDSGLPDKTVRYDRGTNVRDEVKQIQTALKKLDAWDKGPTGKFDKEFRSALRKWQGKSGLSADGVYGMKTKEKLEKELGTLNESWLRMAGIIAG